MTCDQTYLLGETNIIPLTYGIIMLAGMTVRNVIQYQDMNNELSLLKFANLLNKGQIQYSINHSNRIKIIRNCKLISKIICNLIIPSGILSSFVVMGGVTVLSYLDPVSNYSLTMTIFWFIIYYISGFCCFGIFWMLVLATFIMFKILIVKFRELREKFQLLLLDNRNILRYT